MDRGSQAAQVETGGSFRLPTVRQWGQKYLQMYDRVIQDFDYDANFKAARRKVIEHTFRWLEGLSESYWDR